MTNLEEARQCLNLLRYLCEEDEIKLAIADSFWDEYGEEGYADPEDFISDMTRGCGTILKIVCGLSLVIVEIVTTENEYGVVK